MKMIDRVRSWFNVMPVEEARVWRTPTTLHQYGYLVAEWLERKISSQPGYEVGAGPDPETAEMISSLVRANRAGFVTMGSQPGLGPEDDGEGHVWWQREFVDGFVSHATLLRLQALVANTEGVTLVAHEIDQAWIRRRACYHHDPDSTGVPVSGAVPVSTQDRFPDARPVGILVATSVGRQLHASDIDVMTSGVNSTMWEAFLDSWFVTVYDTEWGRDGKVTDLLHRLADMVEAEKHHYVLRDTFPSSSS